MLSMLFSFNFGSSGAEALYEDIFGIGAESALAVSYVNAISLLVFYLFGVVISFVGLVFAILLPLNFYFSDICREPKWMIKLIGMDSDAETDKYQLFLKWYGEKLIEVTRRNDV